MDKSWVEILEPVHPIIKKILNEIDGDDYYPIKEKIFKALDIPRNKVRAIIVGQDPYPSPGMAEGLSFSVPASLSIRKIPPSLRNIFLEYQSDLHLPPPQHGHLGSWVENGVLLLNRILTVKPNMPLSHRNLGWELVTDAILGSLADQDIPIIAWGKTAQVAVQRIGFTHLVTSPHPSPLSAYRGFFGSKPFTRVNSILERRNFDPIEWSLH